MSEARPRRSPPTRWVLNAPPDEALSRRLADGLNLPIALGRLLAVRGFTDLDRAKRYLRPQLEHLNSPRLLPDLDVAVDRLARAIRGGETILVHGDYDVDGICSTTLMTRAIRSLGGTAIPFIPDRQRDGYDLGPAGVQAARAAAATVVLTCDCGTTAVAAARDLRAAGIDLIVTDHHLPADEVPQSLSLINPRRRDDTSPDKDLAAVGVAFKLALELTRSLSGNENVVLNMLDLVALATVADVAPLRGENRVFAKRGLAMMEDSKTLGLRALVRSAGLDGRPITAGRVGYILAPRLNALGRLDRALMGVDLLLANREDEALTIARHCEERNRERQEIDRAMLEQAMERVDRLNLETTVGIVLADDSWHPGVVGIVASRVVEQTARPAFLIAIQNGVGKGSGRSIPAVDLHAVLTECAADLTRYGGHRAAAGLTIDSARIGAFAERFNEAVRARVSDDDLKREIRADLELPLTEATEDLEKILRYFEPFGVGNPGPVFVARGARVTSGASRIGVDGVKCLVQAPAGSIEAVGWGMADRSGDLRADARIDLLYRLERNEFRGVSRLQVGIVDFRSAA